MKNKKLEIAQFLLRVGLSLTMLSAVADRFGLWGDRAAWGNWENFESYTQKLTFFLPTVLRTASAYIATFLEILFAVLLLLGYKTKWAAYGTSVLLVTFALTMSLALGVKAPLDYSVWVGAFAAFLLAEQDDYRWSLKK